MLPSWTGFSKWKHPFFWSENILHFQIPDQCLASKWTSLSFHSLPKNFAPAAGPCPPFCLLVLAFAAEKTFFLSCPMLFVPGTSRQNEPVPKKCRRGDWISLARGFSAITASTVFVYEVVLPDILCVFSWLLSPRSTSFWIDIVKFERKDKKILKNRAFE